MFNPYLFIQKHAYVLLFVVFSRYTELLLCCFETSRYDVNKSRQMLYRVSELNADLWQVA